MALVHPDDADIIKEEIRRSNVSGYQTTEEKEYRLHNASNEWRWVASRGTRVVDSDGKFLHFIGIIRDVTERRQMEEELHQKVKELEEANERLKELDKMKDNFLSTVSHELRTPLTSIKSFAEILLNYDEDRATQKEFLGIINEESERLTRLINDFLDLARIQSGRVTWHPVAIPVKPVIDSTVITFRGLIEKSKFQFSVEIEPDLPNVLCDKDRLTQVVTNLLGNAVKFTPDSGRIGIKAQLFKSDGSLEKPDMVKVSFTDSGIGIAPEHHQSIFEKFGKVGDVLKDRPKGTGLGLPICKEIVERCGGKIWVESKLGEGSTFHFTLPIAPDQIIPKQDLEFKPGDTVVQKGKTILVVDDEANIRRFIQHELVSRGYKVIEASGGKEAITFARQYHPDLITLDIVMPDLDGFDVTTVLKNDPQAKNIPILIVSVVEDQEKAYRLGANDYITKPLKMEILMETVNRLLSGSQKTILVVDDDKNLVKSLEFELHKHGFTTHAAYNGKSALKAVESNRPDLILLDIKMPEMDGYDVIKALKNKQETAGIHIVVMTGVEIDGARVKAYSIGADEFIDKGEGFSCLFKAVDQILSNQPGG
jgi:signal transduction histidine kinase/CheY-like chemotaxis protein